MDKRKQLLKTERTCLQRAAQRGFAGGLGFGQAQRAGDQAGEQGVAFGLVFGHGRAVACIYQDCTTIG